MHMWINEQKKLKGLVSDWSEQKQMWQEQNIRSSSEVPFHSVRLTTF
jgi:hypothetical protein